MFVHLAPEKAVSAIRRSGIRVSKHVPNKPSGVFAMPVTPNFYISHQWLRELKRAGQSSICGVYFRVKDDEALFVGHYNSRPIQMTAAQAAGLIHDQNNSEGYEIIVPRKIFPSEIQKIRHLPQILGWRYQPGAHASSFCGCPVCVPPGTIKSRRKRSNWERKMAADEYDD